MNMLLIYGVLAAVAVSLVSLVGAFFLSATQKTTERLTPIFLSLAAGTMVGNAVLHLIPESIEHIIEHQELGFDLHFIAGLVVLGFFIFFAIDLFLHSVGKHDTHLVKPVGYMVLIGDAIENLTDGLIIGAAFLLDPAVGLATTLAVLLHEIPIELGDFAVLVHSGMSKKRAVVMNLLSGLVSVVGVFLAYFFGSMVETFPLIMGPVAAGAFLYMVGSSLVPAIRQHSDLKNSFFHLFIALLGTALMAALLLLEHSH